VGGYGLHLCGARYGPVTSPYENGNEISGSINGGLAEVLVTLPEEVLCKINHKRNKEYACEFLDVFYRELIR
jgi:hypothetical protein